MHVNVIELVSNLRGVEDGKRDQVIDLVLLVIMAHQPVGHLGHRARWRCVPRAQGTLALLPDLDDRWLENTFQRRGELTELGGIAGKEFPGVAEAFSIARSRSAFEELC